MKGNTRTDKIIIISLLGIILLSGCTKKENFKEFEENIIIENNKTYRQHLVNYYDVDYEVSSNKILIEINNPCLEIRKSCGSSMKPTLNDECELGIVDTCYEFNKLEVGDVIIFDKPYADGYILHRITDIDYKKGWVKTQGDNNEVEDDFTGKDLIYGKTIGFLEVLDDKKVVKEEIIESNDSMIGYSINPLPYIPNYDFIDCKNNACYHFEHDNQTTNCTAIGITQDGYLKCLNMEEIE